MVGGFPLSLFERIADVLDADLDYDETRSGPAHGHDPFADGEADLGWICSTSFVDLSTRGVEPSIRIGGVAWVPDDPDSAGRPVYFGDVLSRTPAASLDALAGQAIGCNDEVSLSGHFALRLALVDRGHDPDTFAKLTFTGGHRRSLDRVAAGTLDAAVVDSVVRADASRTDRRIASLHHIERLGPWPTQPLVASTRLPQEQVDELRDALLASNDDERMQRELAAAALVRFVAVDAEHYAPVRQALERV